VNHERDFGYIESAQRLVKTGERRWNQLQLRRAAEAAELRYTGWPIGLVVPQGDSAPIPSPDGIEARLKFGDYILHAGPPSNWVNSLALTLLQVYSPLKFDSEHDWQDYWSFNMDGSYYVIRLFEEDFNQPSLIPP
jgi:hypothetical protein